MTTTLNNIPLSTGSLNVNSNKITNVSNPTLDQDAVTLNYL